MKMLATAFAIALGFATAAHAFSNPNCKDMTIPDPTVTLSMDGGKPTASPDSACVQPGNGNNGSHKVHFTDHTKTDKWSVYFADSTVCVESQKFDNGSGISHHHHKNCTVKLPCQTLGGCPEKYNLTINKVTVDPQIIVIPSSGGKPPSK